MPLKTLANVLLGEIVMDLMSLGQGIRELARDPAKNVEKPFGQQVSDMARNKQAPANEGESNAPTQASVQTQLKLEMNVQIMQTTVKFSSANGDNSMRLLFESAIEGINAKLEAVMGPNAIQKGYDEGLDVSPEATAKRILDQSTAFFPAYLDQHPEMSLEEARASFADIIAGGIDTGFAEARDILDGLNVLEGDIADNIDKTYDLVQKGLDAFRNAGKEADDSADAALTN